MQSNPYSPPKADVTEVEKPQTGFRDLSKLTKTVSTLLIIGLAMECVSLVSALMQLALLSSDYSAEEAGANDLRERIVNSAQLLLFVGTSIFFLRWVYLAHRNLPELGARHLRMSPGWAVGSFFIPLITFWKPFQAMNDLVRASRDPRTWHLENTPAVVGFWWALWLIVMLVTQIVDRVALEADTVPALHQMTLMKIVLAVIGIPLYLLARRIVLRVWRDQSQTVLASNPMAS